MRLRIERANLLKALNHVHRVVERRNTIPILGNVLLERGDLDAAERLLRIVAEDTATRLALRDESALGNPRPVADGKVRCE